MEEHGGPTVPGLGGMLNLSASSLFAGVLFGAAGIYFFRRAKGDGNLIGMLVAIAMLVYPYVITNDLAIWLTGFALFAVAWRTRDG